MEYIERELKEGYDGCFLCDKSKSNDDENNLVLLKGTLSFVVMNLYPYNNAHLMVSPYRHISDFTEQTNEERSECQEVLTGCVRILKKQLNPDGFNIGLNIGKAGGAGLEEHLHWHLVPRWNGDTNFMPVVGHTKVVMDGLLDSYKKLLPDFKLLEKDLI